MSEAGWADVVSVPWVSGEETRRLSILGEVWQVLVVHPVRSWVRGGLISSGEAAMGAAPKAHKVCADLPVVVNPSIHDGLSGAVGTPVALTKLHQGELEGLEDETNKEADEA